MLPPRIKRVNEPVSPSAKPFTKARRNVIERGEEASGIEHRGTLAPLENIGVEGVEEEDFAEWGDGSDDRGVLDEFGEEADVEGMVVIAGESVGSMMKEECTNIGGGLEAGPTRVFHASGVGASQNPSAQGKTQFAVSALLTYGWLLKRAGYWQSKIYTCEHVIERVTLNHSHKSTGQVSFVAPSRPKSAKSPRGDWHRWASPWSLPCL